MPLFSHASKKPSTKNNKKNTHKIHIDIFGKTLDYAASFTQHLDGYSVPKIVRDCITYVETNALSNEGIYRLSGSTSKIEEIKQKYDIYSLENPKLYDGTETSNDIASLLKSYLRRLSVSILSWDESAEIGLLLNDSDDDAALKECEICLLKLSDSHYYTLGYICRHLKNVTDQSDINKMTSVNIAIVFSPTLSFNPRVLISLIKHSQILFPDCNFDSPVSKIMPRRTEVLCNKDMEIYLNNEIVQKTSTLEFLNILINNGKSAPEYASILDIRIEIQKAITSLNHQLKTIKKELETTANVSLLPSFSSDGPLKTVNQEVSIKLESFSDVNDLDTITNSSIASEPADLAFTNCRKSVYQEIPETNYYCIGVENSSISENVIIQELSEADLNVQTLNATQQLSTHDSNDLMNNITQMSCNEDLTIPEHDIPEKPSKDDSTT